MIEGKLRELDHDPANVQVLVGETGMSLWDEGEEFMSIPADYESEIPDDQPTEQERQP